MRNFLKLNEHSFILISNVNINPSTLFWAGFPTASLEFDSIVQESSQNSRWRWYIAFYSFSFFFPLCREFQCKEEFKLSRVFYIEEWVRRSIVFSTIYICYCLKMYTYCTIILNLASSLHLRSTKQGIQVKTLEHVWCSFFSRFSAKIWPLFG